MGLCVSHVLFVVVWFGLVCVVFGLVWRVFVVPFVVVPFAVCSPIVLCAVPLVWVGVVCV